MNSKKISILDSVYPLFFLVGYYLFMTSLERSFGIEAAPLVSKLFLLFAAFFLFFSGRLVERNLLAGIVVLAVVSVSAIATDYSYFEWSVFLFSLNQIVTLFIFLSVRPTVGQMLSVLKVIAWAPAFSLFVGMCYEIIGVGSLFGVDGMTDAMRLQGSTIPAFLAGVTLSAAFSSILLYYFYNNKKFVLLLFFNSAVILLTAARMPIFLCGVILVFSFVALDKGGVKKKIAYGTAFFVSGLIFLMFFGQAILARFGSESSSGRDVLWEYFSGLIDDYWNFGIGFGHSISAVPPQVTVLVGGASAAHNEYLRIAVEIGVIQAWIFYILLAVMLIGLGRGIKGSVRLVYYSGCLLFFVFCYTDNSISTPVDYPLLLVAFYGAFLLSTRSVEKVSVVGK